MNPAQIPSSWVAAGYGVPDVCSRHGQPAVERKKINIISRPPGWSYILILAGAIVFFIVVTATRKTVKAPAWPFCPQCKQQRARILGIGLGLLGLAVLVFIGSIALASSDNSGSPLPALGFLLSFIVLIVSLIVLGRSAPPSIAAAQVTQDGNWVLVTNAHPAFAERVRSALAGAQAQAARQQPPAGYQQPPAGYQQPPAGYQQPPAGYQQPQPSYLQGPGPQWPYGQQQQPR